MSLTEKELSVLSCVEFNASASIAQIQRETKLQEHSVRYHLTHLTERGIIRRMPVINLACAGYNYFGIYFSLAMKRKHEINALLEELMRHHEVVWLAELGGDFQYGIALCVQEMYAAQEILNRLTAKFPRLFFDKSIACQLEFSTFPRRYLQAKKRYHDPVTITGKSSGIELDELDKTILGGMTYLTYSSRRQLAQQLGVAITTLDYRIKRLEDWGVIVRYIYNVDTAQLGMRTHILLIFSRGMTKEFHQKLFEYARLHPAVTHLYQCLGAWDYELNIEVSVGHDVLTISEEILETFAPWVSMVKVLSKFRDLKYAFVPF